MQIEEKIQDIFTTFSLLGIALLLGITSSIFMKHKRMQISNLLFNQTISIKQKAVINDSLLRFSPVKQCSMLQKKKFLGLKFLRKTSVNIKKN